MPIIGTAGHVDHGKSSLVSALTGRDPDRWAEEKRRGLTIDLGFAWTELGGIGVGFVDVPGHERFMKNMLAGVGGLDVALFVVAADEGWMPQSEEHLAVLDLLDVAAGVIALTRIDLVDEETVELARLEIEERTTETVLANWPIVPVSPITGAGLGDVREHLASAVSRVGPPEDRQRPRLWVDRSFLIAGSGLVVTGTLVDGSIAEDERLMLWPAGTEVRVRGLQTHERTVDAVSPGSRAALNLGGAEREQVPRGAMLAAPGDYSLTHRLLVSVERVRGMEEPMADRGAYHLHVGTATVPVRVRLVDEGAAILAMAAPLPLTMGDRFILRETGRRAVVAGGRVLDPAPPSRPSATVATLLRTTLDASPEERADALLLTHGRMAISDLFTGSGGGMPVEGLIMDHEAFSAEEAEARIVALERVVKAFHTANPLRPGIPKSALASQLRIDPTTVEALLIASGGSLHDDGATVRLASFAPRLATEDEAAWESARRSLGESLAVPRASQLDLDEEIRYALVRSGDLIRIDDDLVYLPDQIAEFIRRLPELPNGFTVAQFRDEFGVSRRQAVPLLEWLDDAGFTIRDGDGRTVRPQISPDGDDAPSP